MKQILILTLILTTFLIIGCKQEPPQIIERYCFKEPNNEFLNLTHAIDIAMNSECAEQGEFDFNKISCNKDTGTWWIDLEQKKQKSTGDANDQ